MTQASRIRVVIGDDHDLFRSGLAVFVRACPELDLVGEATNSSDVMVLCQRYIPDIVIMDLLMPGPAGVNTIRAIRQRFPTTRVIALTSFDQEDLVQSAIQAGAISYLLKNVSADELMRRLAVRNSEPSQTSFYIPEAMMKPWIAFFQRPTPDELERRE